jgi:hypothetical protein
MRRFLAVVALATSTLLCVGPAGADTRVYVRIAPPAPIVETRIVAPSRGHIWITGYHRWDGRAYVWVPGRWELPPSHYHHWVAGHWVHERHNGYYWVDGHWH